MRGNVTTNSKVEFVATDITISMSMISVVFTPGGEALPNEIDDLDTRFVVNQLLHGDGCEVGCPVGCPLGLEVGNREGLLVGRTVGNLVGCLVGDTADSVSVTKYSTISKKQYDAVNKAFILEETN
jgi:hypothetical protein